LEPDDQFTFLETVFQIPVAVWPHNELSGGVTREGGDTYDIIDRNQEQYNHNRETMDVLVSPDITRENIEGVEEAEDNSDEVDSESNQLKKSVKKRKRAEGDDGLSEEDYDTSDDSAMEDNTGKDSSSEDEDIEIQLPNTIWNGGKDKICSYCFHTVENALPITAIVSCSACPRMYHAECATIAPRYRFNQVPVLCNKLCIMTGHVDNDNAEVPQDIKALVHRLSKCTNRVNPLDE
jgi:hypothetical protein